MLETDGSICLLRFPSTYSHVSDGHGIKPDRVHSLRDLLSSIVGKEESPLETNRESDLRTRNFTLSRPGIRLPYSEQDFSQYVP